MGMAKNHCTPPSTSLKIEEVFSSPVLFSGLDTLFLRKPEIRTLNVYMQKVLRQILKLHHSTAIASLHTLPVSLLAEARLHIRQFNLLRMVSNLGDGNPLYCIAVSLLKNKVRFSWFSALRKTSNIYELMDPLIFLLVPPSKLPYKRLIKSTIFEYWSNKFIEDVPPFPSPTLPHLYHLFYPPQCSNFNYSS